MRLIPMTGLAIASLMLSANALACDTILGADRVSIDAPGKYCLSANRTLPIEIHASNVELDCRTRTLTYPSAGPAGPAIGIRVDPGENVIVRNCRIEGFPVGIDMASFRNGQLLNNTVLRASEQPIVVHGHSNDPLGEPSRIVGNRILGYVQGGGLPPNWGPALRVVGQGRVLVSNNVIAGYGGPDGLHLMESPDAQIISNQFLDFQAGHRMIRLELSPGARIVHNTIMMRQPGGAFGLSGATGATCIENVFINTITPGFLDCAVTRHNVEQPTYP